MKKDVKQMELRHCDIPKNEFLSACVGDRWKRKYEAEDGPMHFHNVMEIGVCYFGEGLLAIDQSRIPYHGNMISIIPPNHPHQTISTSEEDSYWEFIFLDCEKLLQTIYPEDLLLQHRMLDQINDRAYFLREEELREVSSIVYAIFDEMRMQKEFFRESVRGLSLTLLINLYRISASGTERQESLYMSSGFDQMQPALKYIRDHYADDIKVKNLAAVCHMSESHFRRLFEQNVGMTPIEYLNRVRINKACEMIRATSLSMEEVASRVGYTTNSTFNRNFKGILNTSPFQWKKQLDDPTKDVDVVEYDNGIYW